MISIEVFEPDESCNFKQIFYRDFDDKVIREIRIYSEKNIIRDYLYEYNNDQLIRNILLLGQDYITIIAVKRYHYYENSNLIKMVEELKYEDNKEIKTQKEEHIYNDVDRTCKVIIHDKLNEPIGYELYGYRGGDDFMSLLGYYSMSQEEISINKWDLMMKELKSYF